MDTAKVFSEIEKFARDIGHWPSLKEWDDYAHREGLPVSMTIYYHTKKPWEVLRKELGFPARHRKLSVDDCVLAMKEASIILGEFFTKREYTWWQKEERPDLPSPQQLATRCGGFNKAKEMAGVLTNRPWGKVYRDEEIIKALENCAAEIGTQFSEREYIEWAKERNVPNLETIRVRLGNLAEAKEEIGLKSFPKGPQEKYSELGTENQFMLFLAAALSLENYLRWSKKNNGPKVTVIRRHAGSYEQALLKFLPKYLEKIQMGRKKR